MKTYSTRTLRIRFIAMLILCVLVFWFLASFMSSQSTRTIDEVGTAYMASINEQVAMHFRSVIDLRLAQVEAMVSTIKPDSTQDQTLLRDTLKFNAQARGFESLSLYSRSGVFETIYGKDVQVIDPEPFLRSLNGEENKITIAHDSDGDRVMLLGVSASYPMSDGMVCTALVAALPISYIQKTLSLSDSMQEGALVYSHIIRWDGTYVIREGNSTLYEDYFKPLDSLAAEEQVSLLQQAMTDGREYSVVLDSGQERQHLYCSTLEYSEWYLVTVMPYGTLDESVHRLSVLYMGVAVAGCAVILLALSFMFMEYINYNKQQIRVLEAARNRAQTAQREAEHAQKRAEEAQLEAENASQAKSEFLSNMSHDIRTPMNAIVGMTTIAIANINNQDQVEGCLKKIALSSKHLLGLINDVLDMSKIESGKMTLNMDQVSLREVMDSIVSIVQPQVKAKKQQFNVSIHDISTENVCCDGVRLNQVLLNLLSNAVKFTPEGGSIQISLYEESSPKGDGFVRIHLHVRDSGIGMSPEYMEHIFESFTREDNTRVHKTEGTGLGMSITKYIVDAMGGTIAVHSEQGKGSEFRVTLDLEKAQIQEMDMVLPDWNMLVVDDDRQLCVSTAAALKSIGVRADWTLDGTSAIDMACRRHANHNDYHIILLDWKLPDMDGIQTAQELRRRLGENIPILLISAYDWGEIEDRAKQAGINGFISKPLFKSTLYYGLRQYAGIPGEHGEHPDRRQLELSGRRILLAEDNELNWEIASELLTSNLGLSLDWAENGEICLEMFRQSEPGTYDAILMDIRMPVMTGYEATRAIRALDRPDAGTIPIIAMTADAFSEDIKRCLDCGMNAHVAKPIDVRDVARQLEKFIRHSG